MNETLAVIPPQELVRQSTDIAGLCKEIVLKSAMEIQSRKYVKVEGWQSIATAHGCVASSRDVERVEGGYKAIGEVRRISDGTIVAQAEGFVGEDEPTWFGGKAMVWDKVARKRVEKILEKRHDYAIRAMAQTRAISRACRSAFAHVVVLMDAGLSTTPAEEVPSNGFHNDGEVIDAAREARDAGNRHAPVVATHVHFGKHKGKRVDELEPATLRWFRKHFDKQEAEGKKLSDADRALYEAVKQQVEPTPSVEVNPEDKIPGVPAGDQKPSLTALTGRLKEEDISEEDFLSAMKAAKQIPEAAKSFRGMTNETAQGFVVDMDATIEIVKNWKEQQPKAA